MCPECDSPIPPILIELPANTGVLVRERMTGYIRCPGCQTPLRRLRQDTGWKVADPLQYINNEAASEVIETGKYDRIEYVIIEGQPFPVKVSGNMPRINQARRPVRKPPTTYYNNFTPFRMRKGDL